MLRITPEEKRNLLIQRGFTPEEIESGFRDYINGTRSWNIINIGPEAVRDTCDLYDMAKLFRKDSIKSEFASPSPYDDFGSYSSVHESVLEDRITAPVLDPYIARLVLAANKCCIVTAMSCDGWHANQDSRNSWIYEDSNLDPYYRNLKIVMHDRFSTVWFWIIAETVFGEKWSKKRPLLGYNWAGKFEPSYGPSRPKAAPDICETKLIYRIDRGSEAEAYKKINYYAYFMDKYSAELCEIREKWMAALQASMSNNEIHGLNFCKLRTAIMGPVLSDLQKLAYEWEKEQRDLNGRTYKGVQAWDFAATGKRNHIV